MDWFTFQLNSNQETSDKSMKQHHSHQGHSIQLRFQSCNQKTSQESIRQSISSDCPGLCSSSQSYEPKPLKRISSIHPSSSQDWKCSFGWHSWWTPWDWCCCSSPYRSSWPDYWCYPDYHTSSMLPPRGTGWSPSSDSIDSRSIYALCSSPWFPVSVLSKSEALFFCRKLASISTAVK